MIFCDYNSHGLFSKDKELINPWLPRYYSQEELYSIWGVIVDMAVFLHGARIDPATGFWTIRDVRQGEHLFFDNDWIDSEPRVNEFLESHMPLERKLGEFFFVYLHESEVFKHNGGLACPFPEKVFGKDGLKSLLDRPDNYLSLL